MCPTHVHDSTFSIKNLSSLVSVYNVQRKNRAFRHPENKNVNWHVKHLTQNKQTVSFTVVYKQGKAAIFTRLSDIQHSFIHLSQMQGVR